LLLFFVFTVLTVRLDKSQLNKPISRLNKSLTGFKIRLLRADPETDIFEISPELTDRKEQGGDVVEDVLYSVDSSYDWVENSNFINTLSVIAHRNCGIYWDIGKSNS
jgi:hypothetical protein